MTIPGGWQKARLGDVCDTFSGGTPSRANPSYFGPGVPWIKSGELNVGEIFTTEESLTEVGVKESAAQIVECGTNLIALYGATAGIVGRARVRAAINQAVLAVVPRDDEIIPDFLQFLLQRIGRNTVKFVQGAQPNLNAGMVQGHWCALPPKSEQMQIAAILQTSTNVYRLAEKKLAVVSERRRGLAQQLLTGRTRFKEFKGEQWRSLHLGDVVTHEARVVTKPKGAFLAAGIRSHGKGVFLKPDFDAEDIALDELFQLRADDLVVNITFGWEGAVAIVPPDADGALVSHRFPTFTFKPGVSFPGYFRHVIRQKRFVHELGLASPGGAGRNRVLSKSAFLQIPVELPSFEQQQRIAAVLNACDSEIDLLQKQLFALKEQKRGLMEKLLTGEVRVKMRKEN